MFGARTGSFNYLTHTGSTSQHFLIDHGEHPACAHFISSLNTCIFGHIYAFLTTVDMPFLLGCIFGPFQCFTVDCPPELSHPSFTWTCKWRQLRLITLLFFPSQLHLAQPCATPFPSYSSIPFQAHQGAVPQPSASASQAK